MFIEKYQPYTQFIITYNGEEITDDNPLTLPSVIKGEYKVNLDAIGYNNDDERENLPFTRNGLTWWLVDSELNLLTKEINIGDEVGTKFIIDDSGTLSIVSPSYSAPENSNISVICFLGKPHTLNTQEIDFNTEIFGSEVLPFSCGGSGGGTTFPTFTQNIDMGGYTCDLTYAQTYAVKESAGVGNPYVTIPCVLSTTKWHQWCIATYQENNEEVRLTFRHVPTTVNYGFWVDIGRNAVLYFADNGSIYIPAGDH